MGRERTVAAARRLHHDASLIMTNVQVMAQFVTGLNRTASEVMTLHTLYIIWRFQNTLRIHGRILCHIPITTWLYIQYRSLPATLYMFYTIMYMFTEYTKNTRLCTMTQTGHDRWLYIKYRSLPATLYTFYTIMYMSTEYTKNTRLCTMTQTGHDRRLYNQYRSLPATLYTFYTIMCNTSECTNNTRSCTMT